MSQYDRAFEWAMKQKGRPDPLGFQSRIDYEPGRALAVANYGLMLMAEGQVPIPADWNTKPEEIKLTGIQSIEGTDEEAEYYAALWLLLRRNEYLAPIRRLQTKAPPEITRLVDQLVTHLIGKCPAFRHAWNDYLGSRHQ